jgi:hypothetical protein
VSSWRKSGPFAVFVAGLVVLIQLCVPVSRLIDGDEATRFGWQMFSGSRAFPELVVETPQGDVDIALSDYLIRQRVEIDVADVLPPHLCDEIPNAIAVTWADGEYRC